MNFYNPIAIQLYQNGGATDPRPRIVVEADSSVPIEDESAILNDFTWQNYRKCWAYDTILKRMVCVDHSLFWISAYHPEARYPSVTASDRRARILRTAEEWSHWITRTDLREEGITPAAGQAPAAAVSPAPIDNLGDPLLEERLLSDLDFESLMRSRTSTQRIQIVNQMIRNEHILRKIFLNTANDNPEYLKKLYLKSINERVPGFSSPIEQALFIRIMKEVMDGHNIHLSDHIKHWNNWRFGRPFPGFSFMIGGGIVNRGQLINYPGP